MATGRVPKIQGLGLEEVGVQLGEQFFCPVGRPGGSLLIEAAAQSVLQVQGQGAATCSVLQSVPWGNVTPLWLLQLTTCCMSMGINSSRLCRLVHYQ
jgi:hypothetical protein